MDLQLRQVGLHLATALLRQAVGSLSAGRGFACVRHGRDKTLLSYFASYANDIGYNQLFVLVDCFAPLLVVRQVAGQG
jgi:hypothetical protein